MVNLAQSTSSLNIDRNIRIDTTDNNAEATDEEAMQDLRVVETPFSIVCKTIEQMPPPLRRFIQRKLYEYNSSNTATVKSEPKNPTEMASDPDLPGPSGISVSKTPKKTLKIFARTKRSRESDENDKHDPSVNSKSPRLRNIRLITD